MEIKHSDFMVSFCN